MRKLSVLEVGALPLTKYLRCDHWNGDSSCRDEGSSDLTRPRRERIGGEGRALPLFMSPRPVNEIREGGENSWLPLSLGGAPRLGRLNFRCHGFLTLASHRRGAQILVSLNYRLINAVVKILGYTTLASLVRKVRFS